MARRDRLPVFLSLSLSSSCFISKNVIRLALLFSNSWWICSIHHGYRCTCSCDCWCCWGSMARIWARWHTRRAGEDERTECPKTRRRCWKEREQDEIYEYFMCEQHLKNYLWWNSSYPTNQRSFSSGMGQSCLWIEKCENVWSTLKLFRAKTHQWTTRISLPLCIEAVVRNGKVFFFDIKHWEGWEIIKKRREMILAWHASNPPVCLDFSHEN